MAECRDFGVDADTDVDVAAFVVDVVVVIRQELAQADRQGIAGVEW